LDIENYRSNLGMSAALFDVVTLQLGINESIGALMDDTNRTAVVNYCKAILAALLADNASCKIIVVLPSTDGNTRGGWGANYGATGYKDYYQKNIIRLRELLISNLDAGVYSANVEVSAAAMACDRYYGYARTTQAVASRISTTDEVHTNAVHPDTVGYQQMGDALYAQVLHKLQ
jgi:lysophospholipase L1-like esterase